MIRYCADAGSRHHMGAKTRIQCAGNGDKTVPHDRVHNNGFFKIPVENMEELTRTITHIFQTCSIQPSIQQKILSKFNQQNPSASSHALQNCLQFCMDEYTQKRQQLISVLQLSKKMENMMRALQEGYEELVGRYGRMEEEMEMLELEYGRLEGVNAGLEREIVELRNNRAFLEMEYEAEKISRDEVIKEALRETYESGKGEIDKMTEILTNMAKDLQKKEKRIIEYEEQKTNYQKQAKQIQFTIENLGHENRRLKKEIIGLDKQIWEMKRNTLIQSEQKQKEKSLEKSLVQSRTAKALRLSELRQPLILTSLIRKLNSKSAEKGKQRPNQPEAPLQISHIQQQNGNSSAAKRKNLQKMKSMNHTYFSEQTNQQKRQQMQTTTHEPLKSSHFPESIQNYQQKQTNANTNTGEKSLYRVKSFERLSQFSEAPRFSGTVYNNLGEEYESIESHNKKKEIKNMKSIGLMTEPNEEDQYINSKDFESPRHSPSKRSPSPVRLHFPQSTLHKSCLIDSGLIFEEKYFSAIRSNKTIQKEEQKLQSEVKPQGNLTNFLNMLVSRRTHKKKQQQSIIQIEQRRKNQQESRQRLSKSFIQTFQSIKQSFVAPATNFKAKSPIKTKKDQRRFMSTSLIYLEPQKTQPVQKNTIQPNMKKKINNSMLITTKEESKSGSILDSLVNFTVKRRIKK